MNKAAPIGVFDSGYGGLTVLKQISDVLPQYDYLYLGDNARAPYGPLDFNTIYKYTWEAVQWFFKQRCHLVILACNTASAKALRSIQQNNLVLLESHKRVLGVLRPTTETIGEYTTTKNIGILATQGTVASNSYVIEIEKFFPEIKVEQEACPSWVQLVEEGNVHSEEARQKVEMHLQNILAKNEQIDTLVLACTHYPLLTATIEAVLDKMDRPLVKVLSQGQIVAKSLANYLEKHQSLANLCSKGGQRQFYTTGSVADFNTHASQFFGQKLSALQIKW
jgi:glutamate racemase